MHNRAVVPVLFLALVSVALAGPLEVPDSYPFPTRMLLSDGTSFYTDSPAGAGGLVPIPHNYDFFQYPSVEIIPGLSLVPDLMTYLTTAGPNGEGLVMRSAMVVQQMYIVDSTSTPVYGPTDPYEVTGCIHGLQVVQALVFSTGQPGARQFRIELELAPTDDQTLDSTLIDEAHREDLTPIKGGGRITFYTDETNGTGGHNYNPDDGGAAGNDTPDDWVATVDGRLEFETFGTVDEDGVMNPNVEVLFDGSFANLQDLGVIGITNSETVMKLTLLLNEDGTSAAGSSAEAYINAIRDIYDPDAVDLTTFTGDGRIIDNSMSMNNLPNSPGNQQGGDLYMTAVYRWGTTRASDIYNPADNLETGWMFSSHDPIEFMTMIPEPTTLVLLGGSLVALARRRRRAK